MNKKIIICILVIISILFISGCNKKIEKDKTNTKNNEVKTNNNSVVLYFSATGTTKTVAQKIAKYSDSDIIEIIPKVKYTDKDLDYNSDCRANKEQNDSKSRPEIKNKIDISNYDTIYLGYPIWWGTNPKIILTLLDTYDFTGKTIIPFCTSGSTDITNSVTELRKYNSKLKILDGERFTSSTNSEYSIEKFVEKSELNKEEAVKEMKVIINNKEYIINLEDNATARKLVKMAPLELNMKDLNDNEKYYYLSEGLPVDPYKPGHIEKGDVMLFDTSCIVIFYKSFDTTFDYTKIGHIDNLPDLGSNDIKVKFEQ